MAERKISRRAFLDKTGKAAAGAGFSLAASRSFQAIPATGAESPNEKVVLGLIGCGGRGSGLLKGRSFERGFLGQPLLGGVAAVCDVDSTHASLAEAMVEKQYGRRPKTFKDFRHLLELKEIDAVVIATPDHWHALPFVQACEANKDIFVEKPISHNIVEAHSMLAAAKRFKRVVQVGTWQRSVQHIADAVDFVRAGKLGKVSVCRAWKCGNAGVGREDPSAPPPSLDWDFWLGPAPYTGYRNNRCPYQWRWFYEYGTGETGDSGAHMMDLILLGMGVTSPREVASYGGKLVCGEGDDRTTPDTQMVIYKFDEFVMNWEVHVGGPGLDGGSGMGAEFIGEKGWLLVDRARWTVHGVDEQPVTIREVGNHAGNFLDCIKSREKPRSDIESMAHTTIMCHLGNIAYRVGRSIRWDAEKGLITGDEEAMSCPQYRREYRKPWKLPIYKA
jgi:predicted dehydrogenase